jgi:D-alanine transaminase
MSIAYLNGAWQPIEETRVPVLDRGFLFGDGVYEVIPVYSGRPFRLEQHLERLENNLAAIRIDKPLSRVELKAVIRRLIEDLGAVDQALYLQVTRGVAPKRDHAFPVDITPTVFAMTNPLPTPDPERNRKGFAAITISDERWNNCHIKAITLLANLLARQDAIDAGAQEAIFIRDGKAVEGAASNLFIVRDRLLITPPKSKHLLPGITRDFVLELAAEHGIPYAEAEIPVEELRKADEIWVTSSIREIMPITSLDGKPVGTGVAGPGWLRMQELFELGKQDFRAGDDHE